MKDSFGELRAVWSFLMFNLSSGSVRADDEVDVDGTVEEDLGKSREGSRTDDEVVQRSVFICNYIHKPHEGCGIQ
uniref:Uncharacterized protein n=1 Tax=Spermophilus dauricus TaxID=99837 RepID=A0A8C9PXE5_SPEDA